MSKSIIYAANTTSQTILVNGTIDFGSIVRKYGNNLGISGGNIVANGVGYYSINSNFTLTAGADGTATITLYKDGSVIPGATQSVSTTNGDVYNFEIPTVIRNKCCCDSSISAILSGVAGIITNATIVVEKE